MNRAALPPLASGELHVYLMNWTEHTAASATSQLQLSASELASSLRFRFPEHQHRYTRARAGLRSLLSHYTQQPAEQIVIAQGAHGKPYLPEHPLHFNLAHSGEYVLYAFSTTPDLLLGVDIEKIQERDSLAIAERFFSAREFTELTQLPQNQQTQAFFQIWTQKEAFIKAIGQGLSYPLQQFDVSATGPAAVHALRDSHYASHSWFSTLLPVPEGYCACCTLSEAPTRILSLCVQMPQDAQTIQLTTAEHERFLHSLDHPKAPNRYLKALFAKQSSKNGY